MQVLSLTPEQINGLAEPERAAINQLVRPRFYLFFFFFFFFFEINFPCRGTSLWALSVVLEAAAIMCYNTLKITDNV